MDNSTTVQAAAGLGQRDRTDAAPRMQEWGARAAVAAPLVALFSLVIGAPLYADDLVDAGATDRFKVATGSSLLVLLLLGFALIALWRRHEGTLSSRGHVAAAIALLGTMMAAGSAWDQFFAVPYLAGEAPAVLEEGSSGSLLAGFFISYLVFVIGWTSFAVATLRARILPRAAAITLLAGSVVAIVPAPTALRLLVVSIGAGLLGRALLRA